MRIVYIAHPISGDVEGNLQKISEIYKMVSRTYPEVVPFVPYYATVKSLDDAVPSDRNLGMVHNMQFFISGVIDEVWLFGDRISKGMKQEIKWAEDCGLPIVDKTTPIFP